MRKQIWNSRYGGIGGQIKTDVHLPGLISQLVKKSKIILLGVATMAFLATLSTTVVSAKTQADIGPVDEGDRGGRPVPERPIDDGGLRPIPVDGGGKGLNESLSKAWLVFSDINTVDLDTTFSLHLMLEGEFKLAGWQTDIAYDPQVLQLLSVAEGNILPNAFFQAGEIDNQTGYLKGLNSATLNLGTVSKPGKLLTLTFKAIKEGQGFVRLDNTHLGDDQAESIPISVKDILITVISVPASDVNMDGITNIFDLILVAQKFGEKNVTDQTDTNGDQIIDIFDLILVAQCFGQAAAPSVVNQPESMSQLVKGWIQLSQKVDDKSAEFQQGVMVLKNILAFLQPVQTTLLANYPNPFNPETWIPYQLAESAAVRISIYDATGHLVQELDQGFQANGYYLGRDRAVHWDGKTNSGENVSSGTYFYRIQAGQHSQTRKMVILK